MDVRGRNGNVNAQVNAEFTEAPDWAGLNKAYRWLAAEGWNDMLGGPGGDRRVFVAHH